MTRCVSNVSVRTEGYDSLTVPVHRATTIRYPNAKEFSDRFDRGPDDYVYGLYGTPTHRYLEQKITDLEGGVRTVLAPSGQAAITSIMLHLLRVGERVLLPDTVYGPVRDFADHELVALGISVAYYDPTDLRALQDDLDKGARLIWLESPGSITMEMQDFPAIVALARAAGALVGCDNSWAGPLNFRPLDHGADVVVEALSKNISGHSDVLMGSVTVRDDTLGVSLKAFMGRMGINACADDCVMVMRGIETLAVRLLQASRSAIEIANWLEQRSEVKRVLHPELASDPGHQIWKRDFKGSAGVFGFELTAAASEKLFEALDALEIISIGASWGGTKSLLAPSSLKGLRTATVWRGSEFVLRLSVGMEATPDLIQDLSRFLDALRPTPEPVRAVSTCVEDAMKD
ncbi:trans-sulfuration enzyme family protein [Shimia sp.]|uniref:trans-sulfuration enzyme family protein n=1 Tax=Shimia sp. TaxID=1954381 RepID=UPI003B8B9807